MVACSSITYPCLSLEYVWVGPELMSVVCFLAVLTGIHGCYRFWKMVIAGVIWCHFGRLFAWGCRCRCCRHHGNAILFPSGEWGGLDWWSIFSSWSGSKQDKGKKNMFIGYFTCPYYTSPLYNIIYIPSMSCFFRSEACLITGRVRRCGWCRRGRRCILFAWTHPLDPSGSLTQLWNITKFNR